MSGQFGQIVFIVWRESVEALLIVGILNAWLSRQIDPTARRLGRRSLWVGVLAGLVLAAFFAMMILFFTESLSDDAQDYVQLATSLIASGLILQMVFWMRRHARTLKRDLEFGMDAAAARSNWWALFVLALVAVAREGSETVVFLYGSLSAGAGIALEGGLAAAAIGLGAALATYALLQLGGRFMAWALFFRITEVMLLLLAAALLLTGIDRLIGLDILPTLSGQLWNTAWLLDDSRPFGGFVSALTGYRSRPVLMLVLVYAAYWLAVGLLMAQPRPQRQPQRAA